MRVLIADDEKSITVPLEDDLRDAGHEVTVAHDGNEAWVAVERDRPDAVVSDINMPGLRGDELLKRVKALDPRIAVVLVTGYGAVESAVQAMKDGAADYVLKPFRNEQIVLALSRLGEVKRLRTENDELRTKLEEATGIAGVVGTSEPMQAVFRTVRTVAKSDATVLIEGETGTGKERIARALHELSSRRAKPFVAISCAAIPSTLLEDELFGHEKGAYTDAKERKLGRFERAEGGTFFLDDVDDVPMETQVKLLRVLQEREVERLGGDRAIKVDVRVVVATKVDLRERVREGKFRDDLFYRLNVVPVRLPPLRDRKGDLPLIAAHFVKKYCGGREYEIKPETYEAMEEYAWPGNVRELEHAVERAIALSGGARVLKREHLVERSPLFKQAPRPPGGLRPLREVVEDAEKRHLREVLKLVGNHRAQAAQVLGISRKNLWEKLKAYGIEDGDDE
jgi:DNA-binding NtrC family response regulator